MIRINHILFLILLCVPLIGQEQGMCLDDHKHLAQINEAAISKFIQKRLHTTRTEDLDTIIINPVILKNPKHNILPISVEDLENVINKVNEYFEFTDIHFRYCGTPVIYEDDEFYNLTIKEGRLLNELVHRENTINIYIAETVSQNNPDGTVGLYCGVASFPNPDHHNRYILLDGSCLADPSLMAHEIGHFYGLYHTHETSFGEELVNKLNCDIAGDLLCDTPADPLLNNANVSNCRYFGNDVDQEGYSYRPDTRNLMSYAPGQCRNKFSWQQLFRISAVHNNENSYLRSNCNFPDFSVKIDTLFASFFPGQKLQLPVVVSNIGWQDTFGLEVRAYFSDIPDRKGIIVGNSNLIFPSDRASITLRLDIELPIDLPESQQYIIIEVDSKKNIAELNENNNIASLSYRLDYSQLADLSIYPNPASDKVRVFLRGEKAKGNVTIRVYDQQGRLVLNQKGTKVYDTYQEEVQTSNLRPGLYLVMVRVEEGNDHFIKMLKL